MKTLADSCIGVVVNDAGGSNQIFAYLEACGITPKFFDVTGPAETHLFNQFAFRDQPSENFKSWIDNVDVLLTGTSLLFDGEHNARCLARSKSVYSIVVLDHWVNYLSRFVRNGDTCLPDEIWVTDEFALAKAQTDFKATTLKLVDNFYQKKIMSKLAPVKKLKNNTVAFLTSPALSGWGYDQPGEFQAIKYFFDNIQKLSLPQSFQISFSVHPSEPIDKYENFLDSLDIGIAFNVTSRQLHETLSSAKWIVGLDTYAMTLALDTGRQVYSCLPPWAPKRRLPHSGIIDLALL